MNKAFLFLVLLIFSLLINESVAIVTFEKHYGDKSTDDIGVSVKPTKDGGYIFAGMTTSKSSNEYDFIIIKTNQLGDTLWETTIDSPGNDFLSSLIITSDEGFLAAGYKIDSSNNSTIFAAKLYKTGKLNWIVSYEKTGYSEVCYSAAQADDGGYILAGFQIKNTETDSYIHYIKIDSSGNSVWDNGIYNTTGQVNSIVHSFDDGFILTGMLNGKIPLIKIDNAGSISWQKEYDGDYANEIIQTDDSGYAVIGMKHDANNYGYGSAYFIKTDNHGDTLWTTNYLYDDIDEWEGISLAQSPDKGYILLLNDYTSYNGIYVMKSDSLGTLLWKNQVSMSQYYSESAKSINVNTIGSFVIAGATYQYGGADMLFIKLSDYATIEFRKIFGTPGPPNFEYAFAVKQTDDNGYILAGEKTMHDDSYGNLNDCFLLKTDEFGNKEWSNNYGGLGKTDVAWSVTQSSDKGFILLGYTENTDILLIKTDSKGNQQWSKKYSVGPYNFMGTTIETDDGGFMIVSNSSNKGLLLKINSQGDSLWSKYYGTSSRFYDGIKTWDGGYVLCGHITKTDKGRDMYIVKTDSEGLIIWEKFYGTEGTERASSIAQTDDGGFAILGYSLSPDNSYFQTMLIKLNSDGDSLWAKIYGDGVSGEIYDYKVKAENDGLILFGNYTAAPGNTNLRSGTITKTDKTGNVIWMKYFGTGGSPVIYDGAITSDGGFIAAGYITFENASELYLVKTDGNGNTSTSVTELINNTDVNEIYPNPASDFIEIQGFDPVVNLLFDDKIRIYNVLGEIVLQVKEVDSVTTKIDVSSLLPGLYFVKRGEMVEKFIKIDR